LKKLLLFLIFLLLYSCSKEELCGYVNGGGYDAYSSSYYLRVDGKKHYVDDKVYYYYDINDYICLEKTKLF